MRVLLFSLNKEILPEPAFPLGLAFIAAALDRAGHELQVFDLCVQDIAQLAAVIEDFQPEVVALSLRNVDNVAYPDTTTYLPHYQNILAVLRPLTDAVLVLGGPGYSLFAERLLVELQGDYGVVGSGEQVIVCLLDALQGKAEAETIPGLLIRNGNQVVRGHGTLPRAQWFTPLHKEFPLEHYQKIGGMATVQTKRGCPFTCIYCSYPVLEGRKAKMRPIDQVISELQEIRDRGIREVYFVDSVFNNPPEYAKELCRAMLQADLDLKWTCYAAPLNFDEELAALFVQSGCLGVEFGTDTLSPVMLHNLGKSFSVADVLSISAICYDHKLPFCHAILVGGPGETKETLKETVANLAKTRASAVIFMTGLRIIPGTKLYDIALDEGVIGPHTDMIEPQFYVSPAIQPLEPEINRLSRLHKTWIFPGHQIRCSEHLAKFMRERGARGPLWLHMTPPR
ncbi:MAG: cobalamin-dependent protein [Proteobacteria bacterium]|nr:cobalamin-dependent protein [Pseudomonadota bacterium]MBU1639524.1 cobalamin-dependent protein [Pseudomonadota bacterium]